MSRGYGKRQRLVLAALDLVGPFYLSSLARNETELKALSRAVFKLTSAGELTRGRFVRGKCRVFVATLDHRDEHGKFVGIKRNEIENASRKLRNLLQAIR